MIAFLKDCDAAIVGFEPVTERVLSALPNLKIIGKYGNGCESFDFAAMKRHNVRFGYTWGSTTGGGGARGWLYADGAALDHAAQCRDARGRSAEVAQWFASSTSAAAAHHRNRRS